MTTLSRLGFALLLLLLGIRSLPAERFLLDSCRDPESWQFKQGNEFPGAAGSLELQAGKLLLKYDFTKGGKYVAAIASRPCPPTAEGYRLKVTPEQPVLLRCRLVDAAGRCFQTAVQRAETGKPLELSCGAGTAWTDCWGGTEGAAPQRPWQALWLLACADAQAPAAGQLELDGLWIEGEKLTPPLFAPEPFRLAGDGFTLQGAWRAGLLEEYLDCTVENDDGEAVDCAVELPQSGRPVIWRWSVPGGASHCELVGLPIRNPRNCYEVTIAAQRGAQRLQRTVILKGKQAIPEACGAFKDSSKLHTARFGTTAHFGFGKDTRDAFGGWHDWKRLIDDMADCGLKVIRDNVFINRNPDRTWSLSDWDKTWTAYAHTRGLSVIGILWMTAANTAQEDWPQCCAGLAKDAPGHLDVIELGNEPQNFGEWLSTYGGQWNAREADNSTSKWLLAHVKATNAAAEAIAHAAPGLPIIGAGGVAPSNIRALEAGLSPLVTGIVDHPYSYCMPPEKVPWNTQQAARDGIVVGDETGSFAGQIHAYERHFQRTKVARTLWLTEWGYPTCVLDEKNSAGLYAGYSEEAQAVYLLRRNLLVLALPTVKVSCIYDYLDDYQGRNPYDPECHFGLLRADFSHKPSWYAMRNFNTLLADCVPGEFPVKLLAAPLQRGQQRGILVDHWDNLAFPADNQIFAEALVNPFDQTRWAVIWNAQPFDAEFAGRTCTLQLPPDQSAPLVGIDLITGKSFDVEPDEHGIIHNLELGNHPIALRLF